MLKKGINKKTKLEEKKQHFRSCGLNCQTYDLDHELNLVK